MNSEDAGLVHDGIFPLQSGISIRLLSLAATRAPTSTGKSGSQSLPRANFNRHQEKFSGVFRPAYPLAVVPSVTMALQASPIPLSSSLSWRLYETLIFLCCLTSALRSRNRTKAPDLEGMTDMEPREAFRCFVNKLAQVCDNQRGGNTVTAFAILQPGRIEYRFASNRRTNEELHQTSRYVEDLLTTLGNASPQVFQDATQRLALFSEIMGKVLAFNRPRLRFYLSALCENVELCINVSKLEATPDSLSTAESMLSFQPLALRANNAASTGHGFAGATKTLLEAINLCYRSEQFCEYMRGKTRQDRDDSNETPWTKLHHALGRLQSYTVAVKVFLAARLRWPELFEDFFITQVPSSTATPPPENIRRTAAGIMSRLTKDATVQDAYRAHARYFQSLGLDDKLRDKARHLAPIVHAEVLLADSIHRSGRGDARFFNEPVFARYIGASKPTCRLCDLYFHAPPSPRAARAGIEVRRSHHNLYPNWRAADVYRDEDDAARKHALEWVVVGLKGQLCATIAERLAVVKRHDSNTTTTDPVGTGSVIGSGVGGGEGVADGGALGVGMGMGTGAATGTGLAREVGGGMEVIVEGGNGEDMDELASAVAQVSISPRAWGEALVRGESEDGYEDEDGGVRV
ncbi:hypothetical protein VTK26DRAFT_7391 [Humicola hyalothermophila]